MTQDDGPKSRRKRGRGVPREALQDRYPSMKTLVGPDASSRAWVAVFNERPDAMHALLADFIKQVHAKPGRIGQRPMPREEQVDFQSMMFGEENDLALPKLLPSLAAGATDQEMANRVHMSRSQYQRMRRGEYIPDVNELRILAAEFGKPPAFFVEYRTAMVVAALVNLMEERPGIATKLYREYLEVRMKETA